MSKLSDQQIASHLSTLPAWQVEAGELTRTFAFKDFRAALAFVNQVGELAESAGHHPDIDIRLLPESSWSCCGQSAEPTSSP